MESCMMSEHVVIPLIHTEESLFAVIAKLSEFISAAVGEMSFSFENMPHEARGQHLRELVHRLAKGSRNPFIIVALMILKWEFTNLPVDDWGLNESRGQACEFVAWQFLCHLNPNEAIEFLLEELPIPSRSSTNVLEVGRGASGFEFASETETTPLMPRAPIPVHSLGFDQQRRSRRNICGSLELDDPADRGNEFSQYFQFFGLNALEIAAIGHAKKFLSQQVVQRIVNDIWKGEIVFWDSLTVNSKKRPQRFNRKTADPYSRLRVPVYRKMFEAAFFMSFLFLYYSVLIERKEDAIGNFEAMMDIWIVAFAYDELSGFVDAGVLFYQMDFWSLWNLGIIGVGLTFIITRAVGLAKSDTYLLDLSFDIIALQALFLVPRICSLVSLNRYFGSLIPVLKEMTKAFFRFLPVVAVLYAAFATTFSLLARDRLPLKQMSYLLVKVFFGAGTLGLDHASEISPIFGYGLMLVFVSMSNILLLSSLISLMSMSMEGVMRHAREEYLFQLSIYVLESSNSRRLTYFMPPLNLIPLLCIRPLRLVLSTGTVRRVRIILLRATHLPFVVMIWAYESTRPQPRKSQSWPRPLSTGRCHGASGSEPSTQRSTCLDLLHSNHEHANADSRDVREPDLNRPAKADLVDVIDAVERLRVEVERVASTISQRN